MFNDILKALELSSKVHKHQRREFSNEPYINHPIRLASNSTVQSLGSDCICVALLHDCIEDGEYPDEIDSYIKQNFNGIIYEACKMLTHDRLEKDYETYRAEILSSNNKIVLAVKYADSLDNSKPESTMSEKWIEKCRKYLLYSKEYKNCLDSIVSKDNTWINLPRSYSVPFDPKNPQGVIFLQNNKET